MANDLMRKPVKVVSKAPSQKIIEANVKKAVTKAVEDERVKIMGEIGTSQFTCYLCGELLDRSKFYMSTDPWCKTKVTPICRNCAEKIVYQIGSDGKRHNPTPETIQAALEYLDKPWIASVYESSLLEAANTVTGKTKNDVWTSYIKNISMRNYNTMRWRDGDNFQGSGTLYLKDMPDVEASEDVMEMYEINKKTVINALGYDPFETANERDKPLMYSKLVGFLDESTTEDEMKLSACIEITHSFNQSERINSVINGLQNNPASIMKNAATIKSLEETKKNIFSSALNLAKDNGISAMHSNNNTKGANTWTGKVKELKEMNLRGQEINSFDVATSEGMRQVANLSIAAILDQLHLDENDYTEMIKQQKQMLEEAQDKLSASEEESRILRRENKDLKDYLKEKRLINSDGKVVD